MKYFTFDEFTRSTTAERLKIDNSIPNNAIKSNIEYLCQYLLDPLREAYGKPIYISSGYRCPELNRAVKGASNSYHTTGLAADIYVKGASNITLVPIIVKIGRYDQIILEKGSINLPQWIHVGISRIKNRKQILYYNGKQYKTIKFMFEESGEE